MRLNATIKLLYLLGESLFIFLSLLTIIISSVAIWGPWQPAYRYAIDSVDQLFLLILVASIVVLFGSICFGCCGSIRQIKRTGLFSGRRLLSLQQIILIVTFVISTRHSVFLGQRIVSLNTIATYSQYDAFEAKISTTFNDVYYNGICSSANDATSTANSLMRWIDRNCPAISQEYNQGDTCAPNRSDLLQCDTECEDNSHTDEEAELCCSKETLCLSGVLEACPYSYCRSRSLETVQIWLERLLLSLRIISILSISLIILGCLLICYNPRDEIELELYKSGALTQEDVETIQRLKEERLFTFETTEDKRQSINLDQLHERVTTIQRGRAAAIGAKTRSKVRRHGKVSPSPSDRDIDVENR